MRQDNDWMIRKFSGTKWQQVANEDKRKYVLNSYRVLLTRARQGMVIFVPLGLMKTVHGTLNGTTDI